MYRRAPAGVRKDPDRVRTATYQPEKANDLVGVHRRPFPNQRGVAADLSRHRPARSQALGSILRIQLPEIICWWGVDEADGLQDGQWNDRMNLLHCRGRHHEVESDAARQGNALIADLRFDLGTLHRETIVGKVGFAGTPVGHCVRTTGERSFAGRVNHEEIPATVATTSDSRRQAFEKEALPHLDTVYRVALRLSGNESQADDLTQETMLKAFRAWHQYRPGTNVRAWLLTILRNTFINEYRKAKRTAPEVDIGEIEPFTVFHEVQDADPEGRFFDQIVDEEVIQAIDSLPDEFRETLVLSDVEGLSYQEIAEITQVPVGTVKSRIFRARQALQRRLYDYAVEMGYIKRRPE
jgi:RNA polymerase sigma-70 factor (ECF subfamily)